MSENCDNNCSSCGEDCADRDREQTDFREKPHELSHIGKVIAVMSGKGGVGKSLITSLLAVLSQRNGYNTAILDADVTGPSIPKAFGLHEKAGGNENGIFPVKTKSGISVMSLNLLMENDTDPVIWRGPIIAGAVKQFWTDVIWDDVDYMFIDMPPGTGDVPLTVFQSIPVDGIIIVTSPQELVGMIVEKAINMSKKMGIPIIGLVENMSYAVCPNCGEKYEVFGESRIEATAAKFGLKTTAKLPFDRKLSAACDAGMIELFEGNWLDDMIKIIEVIKGGEKAMRIAVTYDNGQVFQHFGKTEQFKVYEIEDGKIISSEVISNNGAGHEALAGVLNNLKIDALICGGIGGGAQAALNQANIKIFAGASGDADKAVESFLAGKLESSSEANCDHHGEDHTEEHCCGEHHDGGHCCG